MPQFNENLGAARETFCRLLAACYYEPGPEFAEEKVFDSMYEAAALLHADLAAGARRLGAAYSAADLESLLVDYTRLFLGPSDALAKPYGSVWLTGEKALMQDSTMAVLQLYREGGFELADDFRELPDHIAAELEFLYLLVFRENEARRLADAAAARRFSSLRKRFLDAHLGVWTRPFAAAVSAGAQSGFYRELAALTERYVTMEAAL